MDIEDRVTKLENDLAAVIAMLAKHSDVLRGQTSLLKDHHDLIKLIADDEELPCRH
jgi:hypothetical protein